MLERTVITIPFTDEGPSELAKLLLIMSANPSIKLEGLPYWHEKPDGVRLLCLPVYMPEGIPDGALG